MSSAADEKVRRILLDHAREAYVPQQGTAATVPIDRRCPACGVARSRCGSRTCIREVSGG